MQHFVVFVVLGAELRALRTLGKCSSTEPHCQPFCYHRLGLVLRRLWVDTELSLRKSAEADRCDKCIPARQGLQHGADHRGRGERLKEAALSIRASPQRMSGGAPRGGTKEGEAQRPRALEVHSTPSDVGEALGQGLLRASGAQP